MVPLVFKTSLGAVRSPEGSTPSLLRHESLFILTSMVNRLRGSQDCPPDPYYGSIRAKCRVRNRYAETIKTTECKIVKNVN